MTQATLTLTEFLHARIAEDDAHPRRLAEEYPSAVREPSNWYACGDDVDIALSVPRALAECEAKRQIITEHAALPNPYDGGTYCRMCVRPEGWGANAPINATSGDTYVPTALIGVAYPCRTLRALALPYRDHPDFDPEWLSEPPFAVQHTDEAGQFTYIEQFHGLIAPSVVMADCAEHGGRCFVVNADVRP